jgi:hypothetical protein
MKICFVDESGDTGRLPIATSPIQPCLVINGLIIDYTKLSAATERFLQLKQRFYPSTATGPTRYLGGILTEIKGSELRKLACESARQQRHVFGFLNGVMDICEAIDAKIVGRVWIKGIGQPFDGRAVYTSSIQAICAYFHDYLARQDDLGIVIADSRLKHLNTQVAHSIFTQKFKSSGDLYDRIIELPTFAHSDNHAGIQIADHLCSAIITPMAIQSYCVGHVQNVHVRPGYADIKAQYSGRIRALQHRYQEANSRWRGGLTVADAISQAGGGLLFQ